jgi:hypothetical protein
MTGFSDLIGFRYVRGQLDPETDPYLCLARYCDPTLCALSAKTRDLCGTRKGWLKGKVK